jgi:hypothetical protein
MSKSVHKFITQYAGNSAIKPQQTGTQIDICPYANMKILEYNGHKGYKQVEEF